MTTLPKPKRLPHGQRIRCAGGYRAYIPAPLPPRIAWGEGLASALSSADRGQHRGRCLIR